MAPLLYYRRRRERQRLGGCGRGVPITFPRRVKSQYAKSNPETEPRKLWSSILLRLKHGSIGTRSSEAQTASPLTLIVPAGSHTEWTGPEPLTWMVPITEPSPIDTASAARTIETIEREKLAHHEAPRRVGVKAFGERRGWLRAIQQSQPRTRAIIPIPLNSRITVPTTASNQARS